MKQLKLVAALAVAFAAASATTVVHAQGAGPIKIGVVTPLTGTYAGIGQQVKWGIDLAIKEIIANVSFVGLKEFDQEPLTKSLRDAGIGEGLPFDRALIDRAEQEIKRQYLSRGRAAAIA